MTEQVQSNRNLPAEIKQEVRTESIKQFAKWSIALIVALLGFTLTGWWLYIEPKISSYIVAAGGIPRDTVLASLTECSKLPGKWETFKEGTGRFIIGAGNEFHPGYRQWLSEGGVPADITSRDLLQAGGEEKHLVKQAEMPPLGVSIRKDLATRDTNMVTVNGVGFDWTPAARQPLNIVPPYVALFFCKKL